MYQLVEVSDVYADACVRDDSGNLLFASLYGRDGALLQLFSALSLKRDEGGFDQFTLVDDAGERHRIHVPDVNRLDKLSGRLPKGNLFGNLAHTWLFEQRLVKPDYVNGIAWMIDEAPSGAPEFVKQQIQDRAWLVMKDLSPVPLLDHWKSKVLSMTGDTAIRMLDQSPYPPLGRVTGFRVELNDGFINVISSAVRSGQLTVDASTDSDKATAPPASLIRLPLGQICMTPGVRDALESRPLYANELLKRHQSGDWGCIGDADRKENLASLKMGWRIMSAYPIDPSKPSAGHGDNTIWIITEADRSVTTLLLPSEY